MLDSQGDWSAMGPCSAPSVAHAWKMQQSAEEARLEPLQWETAVPAMVALLSDEDSKTRANAAGALGNMVRNSDELLELLVATGNN